LPPIKSMGVARPGGVAANRTIGRSGPGAALPAGRRKL